MNSTDRLLVLLRRHAVLVAGAALGLIGGLGIFGLVLGGLIGYLIDELRMRMSGWRRIDRFYLTSERNGIDDREVWLASVTALSGAVLAKTTGWEAHRVERALMRERITSAFNLSTPERETVEHFTTRLFQIGDPAVASICRAFVTVSSGAEEREALLVLLYRVATGQGESVSAGQEELIGSISEALGVSAERFNMLRKASVPTDEEAYRILGVSPETDTEEIKRVYRRLATQFHPDSGVELEEHQRRQTEEAFVRIRNAYERVISERSGQRRTGDRKTG